MRKTRETKVSEFDKKALGVIRNSVDAFLKKGAEKYDKQGRLLDIGPQYYESVGRYFSQVTKETFDLDAKSGATHIGDITKHNTKIPSARYDIIVCTEVLEHTLNPFSATKEMYRLLKPGGILLLSTPFNFRIHGPLPDCWRFTEHGLKELLKKYSSVSISAVETTDRELMPIHYLTEAQK